MAFPTWQPSTDYNAGDAVLPTAFKGLIAVARNDGTSIASPEPKWPGLRESVIDNPGLDQITWDMQVASLGCPIRPNEQGLQEIRQTLQQIKFCLTKALPELLSIRDDILADIQAHIRAIDSAVEALGGTIGNFVGDAILDETGASMTDEDGLPLYEEAGSVLARALTEEIV